MAKGLKSAAALQSKRRATPTRWGLTPREWRAVRRARTRLRAVLSNGELKNLILYGSRARGRAHRGSDIDLFLVYDHVSPEQKEKLEDLTGEMLFEKPRVHVMTFSADELANAKGLTTLLIHNMTHDGIPLEGAPMPKREINRREVAAAAIREAKETLAVAQLDLDHNFYRASISRSYYAVLYATEATLATKGFVAHSHSGADVLFGLPFLRKKLVDDKFKGLFKRIQNARNNADYHREIPFNREDAERWLEQAKEFVTAIESSIPLWLEEQ